MISKAFRVCTVPPGSTITTDVRAVLLYPQTSMTESGIFNSPTIFNLAI